MTIQNEVLILGGKGMLGSACLRVFGAAAVGRDLEDCDLTDRAATLRMVGELAPKTIINCAAATDVDRCKTDRDYADRGNVLAPKHAAEAAAEAGAKLIHISTDFVFSGDKGTPYSESDTPAPVSYYGSSKLAGERAVQLAAPTALIVRTSWMYGIGADHFPGKVVKWAAKGGPLHVVDDQMGSPTYAEDLAFSLKALAAQGPSGLLHLGGTGCATRLAWARAVLSSSNLDVEVIPASSADFPLPAKRPANSCLDCSKAAGLGVALPPWQDGLARYINVAESS